MSIETGILDRWLDQASDRFNPLLVRETRQWVKSPFLMASFLILVGLCWFAAVFELTIPRAFTQLFFDGPPGMLRPDGRSLFALYFSALTLSVFVTVPVTAFFGFTREYFEDAIEILRVTPLSAAQIAWGKLQTALLQMLLYFSAVAPFLCLTYLLQGVGLIVILSSLILIAVGGAALAILGLALGSFSRSLGWQVLNMMVLLAGIVLSLVLFLTIGPALSRPTDLTDLIAGAICGLVIGSFASVIGMGITIYNVRPQFPLLRVTFIDLMQLRALATRVRAFITILRNEFPQTGVDREWTSDRNESFPGSYEQAMSLAVSIERTVNKFPSYGDRHRYVTYDPARQPLRQLLQAFDSILLVLNWTDISLGLLYPRRCRTSSGGRPPVRDLTRRHLDSLEESAAAIEAACVEIGDQLIRRSGRSSPMPGELSSDSPGGG